MNDKKLEETFSVAINDIASDILEESDQQLIEIVHKVKKEYVKNPNVDLNTLLVGDDYEITEINIIYGATINPDLGEDLIVTVIATGFDETNATAKPVEMLIGDNRHKKPSAPQPEQEEKVITEQPKPSQPKRQPFGGDSVEMIPNWLMNRYK